jgi:hypothetical protein
MSSLRLRTTLANSDMVATSLTRDEAAVLFSAGMGGGATVDTVVLHTVIECAETRVSPGLQRGVCGCWSRAYP